MKYSKKTLLSTLEGLKIQRGITTSEYKYRSYKGRFRWVYETDDVDTALAKKLLSEFGWGLDSENYYPETWQFTGAIKMLEIMIKERFGSVAE